MPDKSKTETNVIPRQSWSQESITREKIILRKFINPAIYVEKEMLPARKTSPLSVNGSDEGYQSTDKRRPTTTVPESTKKNAFSEASSKRRLIKNRLIKKCTCSKSKTDCQCHPSDERQSSSDFWEVSSTSSISSTETQITVKIQTSPTEIPPSEINNNMSIASSSSLTSLSTESTSLDPIEKEERIKQWLKRKEQEQKLKKLEEEKIQKQKEEQLALQKEQKNEMYKQWLEKKRQEEKLKKTKGKEEIEKKKIDEERLKKQSEGEQMFQSWLKIKKKEKIEKKLQSKQKELKEYEEKKKRLEESQRAFDEWLKNSKHKQKPVPSNQGLSSLFLSNLVTYVNPEPWVGNLEHKKSNEVQTTFSDEKDFPVVGSEHLITKGFKNY